MIVTDPSQAFDQYYQNGVPRNGRSTPARGYGPVHITLQHVAPASPRLGPRPFFLEALVRVTDNVNRGAVPEPSCGFITAGEPGVDKGHIMALELGGPNIGENILPQWSRWQRAEDWRKMESDVKTAANSVGGADYVYFSVQMEFRNTGTVTPTLVAWSFPRAFYVTAYLSDVNGHKSNGENGYVLTQGYPLNNLRFEGYPDNWNG